MQPKQTCSSPVNLLKCTLGCGAAAKLDSLNIVFALWAIAIFTVVIMACLDLPFYLKLWSGVRSTELVNKVEICNYAIYHKEHYSKGNHPEMIPSEKNVLLIFMDWMRLITEYRPKNLGSGCCRWTLFIMMTWQNWSTTFLSRVFPRPPHGPWNRAVQVPCMELIA